MRRRLADRVRSGTVPVSLEAAGEVRTSGYSARSAGDHDELVEELRALPHVGISDEIERRAVDAQRQLARVGNRRLPPVDLILAAIADRNGIGGIGILHYDADFDLLTAKTDLRFKSEWLAPRNPGPAHPAQDRLCRAFSEWS